MYRIPHDMAIDSRCDRFSPFGKVLGDGMKVVDRIFAEHGETPNQGEIQSKGNAYLKRSFPKLSYINSVRFGRASTTSDEL